MTINPPTRLPQLRDSSRAMLDGFDAGQLRRQSHPELSPLLWHVGHVFFVETYWLAERVFGDTRTTDAWRDLYFPEMCAKEARSTRLPDPDALRAWSHDVSRTNDLYWQRATDRDHPLLAQGYLAAFIRQHYAQHLETMRLAAVQLRRRENPNPTANVIEPCAPAGTTHAVAAHRAEIGTEGIEAYDNEQPSFTTAVASFEVAAAPVSNAEWLGFMRAGGYDTPAFWDEAGWAWRQANRIDHPEHWQRVGAHDWHIPTDTAGPIGEQPVHGINWFEARAFARHARARLPHETEWEAAYRAGALDGCHQVWEWCDNAFCPYAGFRAFPYDGYSRPWFDGRHMVARGGSYHTEIEIRRPGFRNFYPPTHRHIFAGLRLAR